MKKNLLSFGLAAGIGILVLILVWPRVPRSSHSTGTTTTADDEAAVALQGQLSVARETNQRLKAELAGIPASPSAAPAPAASSGGVKLSEDINRHAINQMVDQEYRVLLSRLKLSGDDSQTLRDLVVRWKRNAALPRTPEERAAEYEEVWRAMAELAGPDRARLLIDAMADSVSWSRLQMLDEQLRVRGHGGLDEAELKPLLTLFQAAKIKDLPPPRTMADVNAAAQEKRDRHERLMLEASAILRPDQMKVLAVQLADDTAMHKANLYGMHKKAAAKGKP